MKITSIRKVPTQTVYDITVEDAHHYILGNGVITHNSGLEYAASIIIFLSSKKERDKDDKSVTGSIIKCRVYKSRITIPHKETETLLDFSSGLDRYYGLLEIAEKYNIFKKLSRQYELSNGKKVFESQINENPEQYFTDDILQQIDDACVKEFTYGTTKEVEIENEQIDDESIERSRQIANFKSATETRT